MDLQDWRLEIQYHCQKRYQNVAEWLLLLLPPPPEDDEGSWSSVRFCLIEINSPHRFGGPRFLGW